MTKYTKLELTPIAKSIAKGLRQAIAKKKGRPIKMVSYKLPIIPEQVDVKNIRSKLHMTQAEFTQFGFSISAIRHWEAKRRIPEGPAKILLKIIEKYPNIVTKVLNP